MRRILWMLILTVALVSFAVTPLTPAATATAAVVQDVAAYRDYDNNLWAKKGGNDAWTSLGNMGLGELATGGNRIAVLQDTFVTSENGRRLWARDINGPWKLLATGVRRFEMSNSAFVIVQWDASRGVEVLRAKYGLDDLWRDQNVPPLAINPNPGSLKVSGNRMAFVQSGGQLWGSDSISAPWSLLETGIGSGWTWDISPVFVVVKRSDNTLWGKSGISDQWTLLANTFPGSTTNVGGLVKVAQQRITSLSNGILRAKDGLNRQWVTLETSVVGWDTSPYYVVARKSDTLEAKASLGDSWTPLGTHGYNDPIVSGTRIGVWSGGTLYVRDDIAGGPNAWLVFATRVSLWSIGPNA